MREVAGLELCARYRILVLLEQRIEVVDERLHFRRKHALDARLIASMDRRQAESQPRQRRQAFGDLRQAHQQQRDREHSENSDVTKRPVNDDDRVWMPCEEEHHEQRCEREQSERPEDGSDGHSGAERGWPAHSVPIRYPRPRAVSMTAAPSLRRRRATNTSTVFESRSKSCA